MPAKPLKPVFTTQDAATYKGAIDAAVEALARVGFSFAPSQADTPNMTVRLEAGAILSGVTLTEVAAQSTATITAPSTHPRIDRVVIDRSTGAASVVGGTEAASPSAPAIPSGKLPVAQVLLTVGMTTITNAALTDERVGGSSVAIAQNLASPSATEVPSTQAVQDALDALPLADAEARALAMFNGFIAQIAASRSSGPIPSGYMHLFATDELATKTNATFSTNKYVNAGSSSPITGATATATSYQSGYPASYVLDGVADTTHGWQSNIGSVTNQDLDIDFGGTKNVGAYDLYGCASVLQRSAKDWDFQIWTGSAWSTVDSQRNVTSWSAGVAKSFTLASTYSTAKVRFHIIANNGDGNNISVDEAKVYEFSAATNITLIPTAITAGSAPDNVDFYMLHKAVDAVTLNTDLKARVSRDNGSNWSGYVTLAEVCQFDANFKLLKGTADLSALASGTSVKWEVTTLNTKSQQVRAVAMLLN